MPQAHTAELSPAPPACAQARQLAQTLHDELVQLLSLALIQLDSARHGDARRALDAQQRAHDLVKQALQATRDALELLQPAPIHDLATALKEQVRLLSAQSGQSIQFSCAPAPPDMPEAVSAGLLAAARELLVNACKHGGGGPIQAGLARHGDGVALIVRDQGLGFDPELAPAAAAAAGGGYGLPRLRQRLNLLGLSLELQTAPGRGVQARVAWPDRLPTAS